MSPRPNVSEERTKQILEAASAVFAEKGFYKARMDDIAAKAGLSKGTLYLYFKSKDALITALLDRLFQHEMRDLSALQHAEGTASERLQRFLEAILDDLSNWLKLIPVAYEFLGLIFRNKTVQKAFRQYLRTYVSLAIPIIEEGIASGEFHSLDPQDIALAFGALVEGTILLWVYDPETVDVEKHIRAGIDILLKGIQA
ncbi:MAG: TetR/AcrR family transcriptional regulator [Anaerolineae bacterium]|nr:MAG: TetR/AcrR family transcriptional regulator [Anaerolineae bacterium]